MHAGGKSLALSLLSLTGAFRLGRRLSRRSLVVLTYHCIVADDEKLSEPRPPNTLFVSEFEEQIDYIARRYHVATGEEVHAFLSADRALPAHSVFITFDDGYENNYTEALPVLLRHKAPAAFFLTADLIGRVGARLWFDQFDAILSVAPKARLLESIRDRFPGGVKAEKDLRPWIKSLCRSEREKALEYLARDFSADYQHAAARMPALMNWNQAREMAACGMTIGSHTASHQILAAASREEIHRELAGSRSIIEKEIGRPCWCFSYPNGERGDFSLSDKAAVEAAGYGCAFTQIPGFIAADTDRYALPRMSIPGTNDIRLFASRVTGVHHAFQTLAALRNGNS